MRKFKEKRSFSGRYFWIPCLLYLAVLSFLTISCEKSHLFYCFSFSLADLLANKSCNDDGMFLCRNKRCINESMVCDGFNNCGDLSDEIRCS